MDGSEFGSRNRCVQYVENAHFSKGSISCNTCGDEVHEGGSGSPMDVNQECNFGTDELS
jgi:hypothetical protein